MGLKEKLEEWDTSHEMASRSELKPTLHTMHFDADKVTITLMGDMHIGSRFYNLQSHEEILEWCLENSSPIILMGDSIEAATRDSVGAGIYEQEEIIDKQLEHFYKLFKPVAEAELLLGLHSGNHEGRIYKSSGLDLAKVMARELKVPYFEHGKLHTVHVGDESYTLYTCHGHSGARLPHTKIKSAIDLSNLVEAEIYAMGHLHQLSHHVRNYYKADLRNKKVVEAQKHFLICGSYLNHWGSYAHIQGLEPVRKGSPKVKLHGDSHLIRVSL